MADEAQASESTSSAAPATAVKDSPVVPASKERAQPILPEPASPRQASAIPAAKMSTPAAPSSERFPQPKVQATTPSTPTTATRAGKTQPAVGRAVARKPVPAAVAAKPAKSKPIATAPVPTINKPAAAPTAAKPPVIAEAAKPPVIAEAPKPPVIVEAVKPPVVAEAVKPPVVPETPKPAVIQAAPAPAISPVAKPVTAPSRQLPIPSPVLAPKPISSAVPKFPFFKETFIMETSTFDFSSAFKTAFSEAQEKAKAAYEKSTEAVGDVSEFAKGNVEALVESSKILASGLQELTSELVAESRESFETLTADVKSIAAVKSPAEFFSLQSEIMRKQMDALIANGTRHSEAFIKLATDAAAPISGRVSLAVAKVKEAA